jgi:hypothetical protein
VREERGKRVRRGETEKVFSRNFEEEPTFPKL